MRELNRLKAIRSLMGLGCSPVVVEGNRQTFLGWIGTELKQRLIGMSKQNGAIHWKLPKNFLEEELETALKERRGNQSVMSVALSALLRPSLIAPRADPYRCNDEKRNLRC